MSQTLDPQAAAHLSEVAVSVELQTADMTLNIGPQHPSTHGVLRLVAKIDGERIKSVEPVIGYMHRGYEKLAEVRTYPQVTALVNRIDWVSGFANEIPLMAASRRLARRLFPNEPAVPNCRHPVRSKATCCSGRG